MSPVALREAVRQAVVAQLTKIALRQKAATFKIHADSILRIASNIADSAVEKAGTAKSKTSWEGQECAECGDILVANEEGQPTCTCCGRPGPRKPEVA